MMQTLAPFPEGDRALELACYKGEFAKKLCSYFDEIRVIEGASDLIEEARKNVDTHVRFLQGMFETIVLGEQFDAILTGVYARAS